VGVSSFQVGHGADMNIRCKLGIHDWTVITDSIIWDNCTRICVHCHIEKSQTRRFIKQRMKRERREKLEDDARHKYFERKNREVE